METRAHHFLIGTFAIGMIVLTVLFLLWIGKIEFNKQHQIYDLHFSGSVSGLSKAADVLYGVEVTELGRRLDPFQNLSAHYLLTAFMTVPG